MNEGIENNYTGLEIAVIGMSGRFPGAGNIDEFWENLVNGEESITFFSEDELKRSGIDDETLENPTYIRSYGWMEGIDRFDASFFNYTPLEAEIMDPQVRIFHECVLGALEDAGYDPFTYKKLIGIYAGALGNFYWQARLEMAGKNRVLGNFSSRQFNDKDFMCARVAHKMNLKGPALQVDTACSTALVAVHMACQSLLSGDCDIALAGGVSIGLLEKSGYMFYEGALNSSDGHCRAFDARARGTNVGNGAGVVALKRLDDAAGDGDTIHAVIRGSSVNNDGFRKSTFNAPSVEGQAGVIRTAGQMAEVDPETIGYVEAHGTGTPLGDPVEIEGLKAAFNTGKKHFCRIGSVKTNLGHLETASGIAAFIKTVLVLKHRLIPPSLFFEKPNPRIDFENSPFVVNTGLTRWERGEHPLRAGVNSFAIGGTNAHVVLEEWTGDGKKTRDEGRGTKDGGWQLVVLSAKSENALEKMTENLAAHLEKNPGIDPANVAYTLQVGRGKYKYRRMTVCGSVDEAVDLLTGAGSNAGNVVTHCAEEDNPPVVFRFPGVSPDVYENMGRELYEGEPLFREPADRCFEILSPPGGDNRSNGSYKTYRSYKENPRLELFIFQYALAGLLIRLGVKPAETAGHGAGEYAAACVSGKQALEDTLTRLTGPGAGDAPPIPGDKKGSPPEPGSLVVEIGPALSRGRALLEQVGKLWLYGIHIKWDVFHAEEKERGNLKRISLPPYPFERLRYWIEAVETGKRSEPALLETGGGRPRPPLKNPYIAPGTQIEETLAGIWQTLFGYESVGIGDDFMELGGHSLKAVFMLNRVRSRLKTMVPLTEFFKDPTIKGLGRCLTGTPETGAGENVTIMPVEKREYYPLSYIQKRVFVLDALGGIDTAYNNTLALMVEGNLHKERVEEAAAGLIRRHGSLRTSFDLIEGEPAQMVHENVDFKIRYIETDTEDIEKLVRDFVGPFDLKKAPLMRISLVKLDREKHLLLLDLHHIITDGTSFTILTGDFIALYEKKELPPLVLQYKDYAQWQYGEMGRGEMEKQEKYWLRQFEDGVPVLNLKTDFPRPPVQRFEGESIVFRLEEALREPLKRLIKDTGTTLYIMLLAICNVLLYKYTGREDIVIGSPAAARDHVELENLVGMFINPLVLRNFPRGEKSFLTFLREVRGNTLAAFENQGYPFGKLLDKVDMEKDLGRNALYDFELIVQNMEAVEWETGELRFRSHGFDPRTAQVDITLEVREITDGMVFKLIYCTALFKRETMEQLIRRFKEVTAAVTAEPGSTLDSIRLSLDLTTAGAAVLQQDGSSDFGF